MTQPRSLRETLSVAIAMCALAISSYGQNSSMTSKAAPAPKTQASVPVTMAECEGINNCATWTFLGGQGNGNWPSGEIANLKVESSDNNTVVIQRADSTGASAGLTAVYIGTRHGDRVSGEYTSSWPGHWDKKSGDWYATVEKNPVGPPQVMHMCIAHCFVISWENGHYVNYGPQNTSVYTVESFTRDSVILHRTDTGSFPLTAVLSGKLSADGNSIVNGKIVWTSGNSGEGLFKAAWGNAINTVPATDAQRDGGRPQAQQPGIVVRPIICVPWFFTVVCG